MTSNQMCRVSKDNLNKLDIPPVSSLNGDGWVWLSLNRHDSVGLTLNRKVARENSDLLVKIIYNARNLCEVSSECILDDLACPKQQ